MDAPHANALLAQPGPLLHEVLEDLGREGHDRIDRTALLDGVRQTLADEAALQADDAEADFRESENGGSRSEGARPEPETVHWRDPKTRRGEHPRRLIVRRDARRGRPKKKHGSDPPGR